MGLARRFYVCDDTLHRASKRSAVARSRSRLHCEIESNVKISALVTSPSPVFREFACPRYVHGHNSRGQFPRMRRAGHIMAGSFSRVITRNDPARELSVARFDIALVVRSRVRGARLKGAQDRRFRGIACIAEPQPAPNSFPREERDGDRRDRHL